MTTFNGWIIGALIKRLRQPGMRTARRFVLIKSLVLAIFLVGASFYIFRQPTEDALEMAALKVFAAFGVLIAILICIAVFIRRRTRARWTAQRSTGKR
jgi:hypothetical protein